MKLSTFPQTALMILLIFLTPSGCHSVRKPNFVEDVPALAVPLEPGLGPSFISPHEPELCDAPQMDAFGPEIIQNYETVEHTPITLQECIRMALENSSVVRDLGVGIVRSPGNMVTQYDPAIAFSDARFGEEAALSSFDANLVTRSFLQKNDRPFNNRFLGSATGILQQDLWQNNVEINKTAATGTRFAVRSGIDYDANNQAGNRWGNSWQAILESEIRQPLLQGNGVFFNRIAGPNAQAGSYNGVLIARTNTEIGLTRFEQGVRDLVSNVENAYWDLYFAYRDLESQITARDEALEYFARVSAKNSVDQSQPSVDGNDSNNNINVISAQEQILRFETSIINSLEGQINDATRTDGGSSGGSFRGNSGVRLAERRLRYLIGLTNTDGRLLQPSEQPLNAPVTFNWQDCVNAAAAERPELRQQRWVIKQRQLELTAAKNFLLPRLDLVATNRIRGLGKDLTGGSDTFMDDVNSPDPAADGSNAFGDLLSGDFHEWQVGAELSIPVGFRRGHNAVKFAELRLQREKAVLREQERAVSLSLANAVTEVRRAYSAMLKSQERHDAARKYKEISDLLSEQDQIRADVVLEASRRVFEATQQYYRSQAEYMIAIKNVHFEKGTLLDYNQVFLGEAAADGDAYNAAEMRMNRRGAPMNYLMANPNLATGAAPTEMLAPVEVNPSADRLPPIVQQ